MEGGAARRGKPPEGKKRAAPAARVSSGRREGGSPEGFAAAGGRRGSPLARLLRVALFFVAFFASLCVALFAALPTAAAALVLFLSLLWLSLKRCNLRANDTYATLLLPHIPNRRILFVFTN